MLISGKPSNHLRTSSSVAACSERGSHRPDGRSGPNGSLCLGSDRQYRPTACQILERGVNTVVARLILSDFLLTDELAGLRSGLDCVSDGPCL